MTNQSVEEVREDLAPTLHERLAHERFRAELVEGPLQDFSGPIVDIVLSNADKIRTSLLGAVDAIPVPDEQHRALACSYLELKAQWIQRNVRLSYEGFVTGSWDPETSADAAVIAYTMLAIEPLIDPAHVRQIHELFLNQLPD